MGTAGCIPWRTRLQLEPEHDGRSFELTRIRPVAVGIEVEDQTELIISDATGRINRCVLKTEGACLGSEAIRTEVEKPEIDELVDSLELGAKAS
jgi:hypothetical protein